MIKKIFLVLSFFTILLTNSYSAGSSDDSSSKVKSNYDKAVTIIKSAKKYEKKGKIEKAIKRYEKAQKLLIKSNNKNPNVADTLNYLGFTTRKLGDYDAGEKYYLQGLEIEPNHVGINEYLDFFFPSIISLSSSYSSQLHAFKILRRSLAKSIRFVTT